LSDDTVTSQPDSDVLKKAHRSALFEALSEEALRRFLAPPPISLRARESLFRHGDKADYFYFVLEGRIKLYRVTLGGGEQVVNVMGPGETFGEAIMFLQRQEYPVSAEALCQTTVYPVECQSFRRYLQDHPDVCLSMLAVVCQRLHMRLNDISRTRLKNAEHRLAWYLIDQIREVEDNTAIIGLNISKSTLASRLSMMPETLSRAMARLMEAGVLEKKAKGKTLVITDVEGLRNLFHIDE